MAPTHSYEELASRAQAAVLSQIPPSLRLPEGFETPVDVRAVPATCGLLTPKELDITGLDATAVRDGILEKRWSAVEAVTAFGKRAAIAHQLVCCLTDLFLDEGIERAKELDEILEKTGKPVGPLHGVPVSIKDHIELAGHVASSGFAAWLDDIPTKTAHLLQILWNAGAVFYCKTQNPQTIMTVECHSFYGRTLSPANTRLTCGGSTGGEGALIGMRGSCFGIGTDIGGSIRSPAAANGIWGFKPTPKRTPLDGVRTYMHGNDSIPSTIGPMTASLRDLELWMDVVLSSQPWLKEQSLVPLEWTPRPTPQRLKVGVLWTDGVVNPHPTMMRALKTTAEKLRGDRAFEVVDFKPILHLEMWRTIRRLYFSDGGHNARQELAKSDEPLLPLCEFILDPAFVQKLDMPDLWKLQTYRDELMQEYADHWNASGIDVLLCPPSPGCAPLHDTSRYWGYTSSWNILQYPAAVFPTGLSVDPALDPPLAKDYHPLNDEDAYCQANYDPELMQGAPLSLQLVGMKWQDEKVLAAMRAVAATLGIS